MDKSRIIQKNFPDITQSQWRKEFGKRIRLARQHANMTQSALAQYLKRASNQTVSSLELGNTSQIPLDMMASIIEFFSGKGISLEWLILGIGPMLKSEVETRPVESPARLFNEVVSQKMLLILAKRLEIKIDDLLPQWMKAVQLPDGKVLTLRLEESSGGPVLIEEIHNGSPANRDNFK